MSNSIIEAQQEFTGCFGELTLRHITSDLTLPTFSREAMELDEFIATHQAPAPVKIPVTITQYADAKRYCFSNMSLSR
jgi:hypothetical protein